MARALRFIFTLVVLAALGVSWWKTPPTLRTPLSSLAHEQSFAVPTTLGPFALNDRPYQATGLPQQPVAQLRAAAEKSPKDVGALAALGIALAQSQQPTEAIPLLEKAASQNPKNGAVFFELVGAYLELDQTDRGVAFFQSLLREKEGNSVAIHAALADLIATSGNPAAALAHAETAQSRAPQSAPVQSLLASVYLQLHDPRAEDALRLAEKLHKQEAN